MLNTNSVDTQQTLYLSVRPTRDKFLYMYWPNHEALYSLSYDLENLNNAVNKWYAMLHDYTSFIELSQAGDNWLPAPINFSGTSTVFHAWQIEKSFPAEISLSFRTATVSHGHLLLWNCTVLRVSATMTIVTCTWCLLRLCGGSRNSFNSLPSTSSAVT